MKTRCTVALSMFAGAALGAAVINGLHAQDKSKAYVVSEIDPLDSATEAAFASLVQLAQKAAGGRSFHTGGGKVRGRRLQRALLSVSGTIWSRRRHFTTRQPGTLLHLTVTRLSKRYDGM